jgi:peptide chain release factor 1
MDPMIMKRLEAIEGKFEDLERQLSQPDLFSDHERYQRVAKEHKSLSPFVSTFREWKEADRHQREAQELMKEGDEELKGLAREELEELEGQKEALERRLKLLLLPKDPNDEKDIFLEIRAGAGGEEAALFAADLLRTYQRYAECRGWTFTPMDVNATGLGGVKEVVALIEGRGAYSRLKFERGVHRVQRVPETESGGRIHTSTVTVAVLPEAEELEVEINPEDLKVDVFRASGPGGQHVNVTDSAVRITHLPMGIVVQCQDERSQHKNREKAMRILRARLKDLIEREQADRISQERRSQVGTGDRSERIRTYNFPQNRVTDHRIGLTLHKLEAILDGDLDEVIDALIAHHQASEIGKLGIE